MPSNRFLFERYNNNRVFIETGSYVGEGILNALLAGYDTINSIELVDEHYHYCKNVFKYQFKVNLYKGDTVEELPPMLDKINEPATFWLDAHYSGGNTGFKGVLSPLMQELDIISKHPIKTHTIIIDDLREWKPEYPAIGFGIQDIKDKILLINKDYTFTLADGYVPNDILVAEIKYKRPINIVVFSKDRAMQLDLFLRSFDTFVKNRDGYLINVLYTYSNDNFGAGYEKLIAERPNGIRWVKETQFKSDLLSLVESTHPYTVFFVDDDVIKDHFDFYDAQGQLFDNSEDILCRSLRLSRDIQYCYTKQTPTKQPVFRDNNIFKWKGMEGDFGYPMSVDGHIFRTSDILPLLWDLDYSNPNYLEGHLAQRPINRPKMVCYTKSIVMNNPINLVQSTSPNVHGNIPAAELNNMFLKGKTIALDNFIGINNVSCHQEMPLIFR